MKFRFLRNLILLIIPVVLILGGCSLRTEITKDENEVDINQYIGTLEEEIKNEDLEILKEKYQESGYNKEFINTLNEITSKYSGDYNYTESTIYTKDIDYSEISDKEGISQPINEVARSVKEDSDREYLYSIKYRLTHSDTEEAYAELSKFIATKYTGDFKNTYKYLISNDISILETSGIEELEKIELQEPYKIFLVTHAHDPIKVVVEEDGGTAVIIDSSRFLDRDKKISEDIVKVLNLLDSIDNFNKLYSEFKELYWNDNLESKLLNEKDFGTSKREFMYRNRSKFISLFATDSPEEDILETGVLKGDENEFLICRECLEKYKTILKYRKK